MRTTILVGKVHKVVTQDSIKIQQVKEELLDRLSYVRYKTMLRLAAFEESLKAGQNLSNEI